MRSGARVEGAGEGDIPADGPGVERYTVSLKAEKQPVWLEGCYKQ